MQSSQFMRQAILKVASSPSFSRFVHRYGPKLGARRFYAGETLKEAIEVVRRLNAEDILVTLDHLGESVTNAEEAAAQADGYIDILHAIHAAGVNAGVSIKLTQMGLDVGQDECLANMRRIVEAAKETRRFIRIDMEDSQHTDMTLAVLHELRKSYPRIGTVLQSYLFRSQNDLAMLQAADISVRIVKGAYLEPPTVAFPLKSDVDQNYLRLVDMALRAGQYVAIATHDENIIHEVEGWVNERKIPLDKFEFQMLYGIRMSRQRELAKQGYRVRCYVPFGTDWYAYYTRRLAERPANILFVLRSLLRS